MSFTLRQIVGTVPEVPAREPVDPGPRIECPTGKAAMSKKVARTKARQVNHTQRTNMRAFRCGYCEHYHLGHARGRVL